MIYICISTLFERIKHINSNDYPLSNGVSYCISCQGKMQHTEAYYKGLLFNIFGESALITFLIGYGISRNRNASIRLALSASTRDDFIYICDDDLKLNITGIKNIINSELRGDASLIAGMVSTKDGLFKNYPSEKLELTSHTCARVSSVEMMLSVKFLKEYKITFDERFGLGAKYPSGEEYILCNDILKNGGKILFVPIVFCEHPPVSSGQDFFSTKMKREAKGAMLCRVFGPYKAALYCFLFSLKKWPIYKKHVSFILFTRSILNGVFSFLK